MAKGKRQKRASGEGTVRKRKDGLWEARLPSPGSGTRSFYSKTQAEAMRKRELFKAEIAGGLNLDAD